MPADGPNDPEPDKANGASGMMPAVLLFAAIIIGAFLLAVAILGPPPYKS
jgi:hypothetical protein